MPFLLDPRTTVLISSITSGLMAVVLTFFSRATPLPVRGQLAWMVGAWLVFASLVLLGLRDYIPNLASVSLGNGAMIAAYLVWLSGTHEHFRSRMNWLPWLAAFAVAVVAISWYMDSFRIRVVVAAGLAAIINGRHAFLLLRHPPRANRSGKAIGITLTTSLLVALTCVYGSRCVHAIAFSQGDVGLLTQNAIQIAYTGLFTICNLMLAIGFATMSSDSVRSQIETRAIRDPLTGALNRTALFESLEGEFSRCRRYGHAFSVLMLDVDHFKAINDQFGHQVGDRVLVQMCRRTASLMRPHDVFARYGGEEFLIVMPETSLPAAQLAGQRILAELATSEDAELPSITVSIGVAQWSQEDTSVVSLVERADRALYIAKRNGRNRLESI